MRGSEVEGDAVIEPVQTFATPRRQDLLDFPCKT